MLDCLDRPLPALLAIGLAPLLLSAIAAPQSGLVTRGPLVLDGRWNGEPFAGVAAGRWHTFRRRLRA